MQKIKGLLSLDYMEINGFLYRLCIVLTYLFSLKVSAQTDLDVKSKDVPTEIREYISRTYPAAGKIRFFKETINDTVLYEAAFKTGKNRYELIFLANNQLGSTKRQVKFGDLPDTLQAVVIQDLKKRYGSFGILKVKEIKSKQEKFYEVKLRLKTTDKTGFYEVYYSNTGLFILEQEEVLKLIPANTGF